MPLPPCWRACRARIWRPRRKKCRLVTARCIQSRHRDAPAGGRLCHRPHAGHLCGLCWGVRAPGRSDAGFCAGKSAGRGCGYRRGQLGCGDAVAGFASVTMLDPNPALRDLARQLADERAIGESRIPFRRPGGRKPQADLVVASYVLAELPEQEAAAVARDLWQGTGAALALIEPGHAARLRPHSCSPRRADRGGRACRRALHARQCVSHERR